MVSVRFFGSALPICSMILHTPMPIVFFPNFLTWGFHSHFVEVRYTTRGPIRRSVVCSSSLSLSLLYSGSPPYLCFSFLCGWYTYNRFRIKCGSCVFMIVRRVINIRSFSVASKMCSLVLLRVGPLYITSSWVSYFRFRFSYFGCTSLVNRLHK